MIINFLVYKSVNGFARSFNVINRPNYILNEGIFSFEVYGSFLGHESNFRREAIFK